MIGHHFGMLPQLALTTLSNFSCITSPTPISPMPKAGLLCTRLAGVVTHPLSGCSSRRAWIVPDLNDSRRSRHSTSPFCPVTPTRFAFCWIVDKTRTRCSYTQIGASCLFISR